VLFRSVGPGLDRVEQVVLLVAHGEHDDAGRGKDLPDHPGGIDAVLVGHADVHEDDVRGELLHLGHRLEAIARLSDDLDALLGLEHHAQPAAEPLVVIGDEDPDRLRHGLP
jgi:hypothetical protein